MMADLAAIFHWSLAEIEALDLADLIAWHGLALARWNRMWGTRENAS
jgi:hypothetical protein